MSTEIATRGPARELVAQIRSEEFKTQVALALPENVRPERFVRVMATALLDNPEIAARAEINSIFQAGLKAAQDGLLPDGREAAFVLFGDACTYMPMIGGFRKIAAEHGWSLRTRVVYAADEFHHELGAEEILRHVPARPGVERGPMIAAYAVAQHRDGRREIEVVYAEDVAKVRAVSRAKDSGPWRDWPERMWEKTAGRRLFAKLPLAEDDRVVRVLEASEREPGEAAAALYGSQPSPPAQPPEPGGDDREEAAEPAQAGNDGAASSPPSVADEDPEASQFKAPAGATERPEGDDPGAFVLTWKKHEGKTIAQAYADDPQYIEFIAKAEARNASAKVQQRAARDFLAALS